MCSSQLTAGGPSFLLYGAIAVVIVLAVVYFLKRRRATP